MRLIGGMVAMGLGLLGASGAVAADTKPCPAGMICATKPETIADALRAAGFSADVGKTEKGFTRIKSSASGFKYSIYFEDCDDAKANCASIRFYTDFDKDGSETLDLANRWNRDKRLGKAYLLDDGSFAIEYDLSTVGGVNAANFKDVITWWESTLGALSQFFRDNPAPKVAAKPAA